MKVYPTMQSTASKTITCDIGDTIYIISAYVVTGKVGLEQVRTQSMFGPNGIVAAFYEYKSTQKNVSVTFGAAGSWVYFIP